MTENEREDMRRTTSDNRKFFEGKTTSRNTTSTSEVSHKSVSTNLNVLSELGRGRHPVARSMPGRSTETGSDDGGGRVKDSDVRGGQKMPNMNVMSDGTTE